MQSSIEMLAGISFLVIGISHIAQPKSWAEFFVFLRQKGPVGVFLIALMTLPMGVLIVSFHTAWAGQHAVLSLIGWGYCLKSLVYLSSPRVGLAALAKITVEKSGKFRVAGVMLVLLSGMCWYSWYTAA